MPDIRPEPLQDAERPISAPSFVRVVRKRRLPVVAISTVLLALAALALFYIFAAGS